MAITLGMIYRYKFKNFFSFSEETEVSLAVNEHVPASDSISLSDAGSRISKVLVIIGPNASGKTNLLKPLSFVHWFINNSFQLSADKEIPLQNLLDYFPVGGETGTLKSWYANDKPFVYAKSGTLSNNYSLSGYLVTKKGKILIFSYMNNHYRMEIYYL